MPRAAQRVADAKEHRFQLLKSQVPFSPFGTLPTGRSEGSATSSSSMGGGGEATNDDGPFHLRYWLQTQPRKMGMCYNHLPSRCAAPTPRAGLELTTLLTTRSPCRMSACIPRLHSLPELAHRLHLSEGEASVIATAKDHETVASPARAPKNSVIGLSLKEAVLTRSSCLQIDYEEYKGLLAPEYTGVGIVGMGGWRRFRRPEERKTKSSKELV